MERIWVLSFLFFVTFLNSKDYVIEVKGKNNISYQIYLKDSKLYFQYKYKKIISQPFCLDSNVSSPCIAITYGDYLHIVWEKGGKIYYKTTLERVYPHLIRRGVPIVWSEKVIVSTRPPLPLTEPASNPFVEAQGEFVYVTWRGPNEFGDNIGEIWQRKRRIDWPLNRWSELKNLSRESNYPTKRK